MDVRKLLLFPVKLTKLVPLPLLDPERTLIDLTLLNAVTMVRLPLPMRIQTCRLVLVRIILPAKLSLGIVALITPKVLIVCVYSLVLKRTRFTKKKVLPVKRSAGQLRAK